MTGDEFNPLKELKAFYLPIEIDFHNNDGLEFNNHILDLK